MRDEDKVYMATPNKSYVVKEPIRHEKIDYTLAQPVRGKSKQRVPNRTKFYEQPALNRTMTTHVIKSKQNLSLNGSEGASSKNYSTGSQDTYEFKRLQK